MHYIRFLKPPRLVGSRRGNTPLVVKAKITVTTDLGESFLWADVDLVVELTDGSGNRLLERGKGYTWKGSEGMRSLEVELLIPESRGKEAGGVLRLLVRPKEDFHAVEDLERIFGDSIEHEDTGGTGGVMAVRSMAIDIPSNQGLPISTSTSMAERTFRFRNSELHIWEETGESIARHIWDAGLLLSAYLASTSIPSSKKSLPPLPSLHKTLSQKDLAIIELGAGCGIVGITLSTLFRKQISQILLTDLPEASEILTQNLYLENSNSNPNNNPRRISHQVLDWSSPLPQGVRATKWDMAVVADCTYNPDVVPDLVQTLKGLGETSSEMLVLLAMKVRHDSEMVFFDLMAEGAFVVLEKCKLPLPVLGGEGEEIEVFVFGVG
ncbi:UPF0665 family protein [Lachnellula hyalina]|uniref:UPF0665 family protein n=1 Tax=Lachnellula hyalina TaxID=1316788 RepID=A0A8H8R2G5_9HELO|nr:UPF0665 family protein [Lachnellula hyalina]TVY26851.1 UPF0665 family protein [Lachnellula hyalina]